MNDRIDRAKGDRNSAYWSMIFASTFAHFNYLIFSYNSNPYDDYNHEDETFSISNNTFMRLNNMVIRIEHQEAVW